MFAADDESDERKITRGRVKMEKKAEVIILEIQVVRCKNCVHFEQKGCGRLFDYNNGFGPNDFCSKGVEKEEELDVNNLSLQEAT